MAKVSVNKQILFILDQKKDWIVKQDIVDTLMTAYKMKDKKITSDTISRGLRDLARDNDINVDYRGKKKIAWYAPLTKEKEVEVRVNYKPIIPDNWN